MAGLYEGPCITHDKRKTCDMCKHCNASKLFGHRIVEVLSAKCEHPNIPEQHKCSYWGNLDHSSTQVFTPDWCPIIDKENELSRKD